MEKTVLVIGRGEIGNPLSKLLSQHYLTESYDLLDGEPPKKTYDVLHICFPYTPLFQKAVIEYIELFKPKLVIIESTVAPGTTREIYNRINPTPTCHSPVLGRAADGFEECLKSYTKFVGPISKEAGKLAQIHYETIGLKTHLCSTPEDTEWAKILETSYWGLLVAWYQDIERIARTFNLDLKGIINFFENVENGGKVPRPVLWVGPLGGHCIVPNARLLLQKYDSNFVADIVRSHLTFEASMLSIQNSGEDESCPLCKRVFTREIFRNETNEPFFIIQCLTCRDPMLVFRSHVPPTQKQMEQAKAVFSSLFPNKEIDFEMKAIRQHTHWHFRKHEAIA